MSLHPGINILARDKLTLNGILQIAVGRNDMQEWRHTQLIKGILDE